MGAAPAVERGRDPDGDAARDLHVVHGGAGPAGVRCEAVRRARAGGLPRQGVRADEDQGRGRADLGVRVPLAGRVGQLHPVRDGALAAVARADRLQEPAPGADPEGARRLVEHHVEAHLLVQPDGAGAGGPQRLADGLRRRRVLPAVDAPGDPWAASDAGARFCWMKIVL